MRTPFAFADSYKLSHWIQYPEEVTYVYSNFTPRKSLRSGIDKFVFFGLQAFLMKLQDKFQKDFFNLPEADAVNDFSIFYQRFFLQPPDAKMVESVIELHTIGHLPLSVYALPEGSVVSHGIPVLVVENTRPECYWLTNFIESWMSAELWQPSTSATTALYYRLAFDRAAKETSDSAFIVPFQGHDFSFRGMGGIEAASASGAAHMLSFQGTDCLPAIGWIDNYYPGSPDSELLGTSVPATEHSVMCAGGQETEMETFRRLLKLYPTGILSVVSDTWDFWQVVTEFLPALKDEIMSREGKLVIRPDSGKPADILCGDPSAAPGTPEHEGLISLLYKTFGGTKNSKGYIDLDPHVGAIYGDSITLDRQEDILARLKAKGFASTNVVLGIGSYTYQYVTRDTHGLAMKATAIGNIKGEITPIFKTPKTDTFGKKSARGLLAVKQVDGEYVLEQDVDAHTAFNCSFQPVFKNGEFLNLQSFSAARQVLAAHRETML